METLFRPVRSGRYHRQLTCVLLLTGMLLSAGRLTPVEGSTNLLRNPSFEGGFSAWGGIPEIQMAPDWTPWWTERQASDPLGYNHRPEYKQARADLFPDRVHGGGSAQQWFTFYATHVAGMYQQVSGITWGARLRFTVWATTWSSVEDDPRQSVSAADMRLQVGIDPTGDTNPWAGTVVWSGTQNHYNTWGQLAVDAVAQGNKVTVFMRSAPDYAVKHNDTYWDDAVLEIVGQGAPPPAATQVVRATATTGTCGAVPSGWVSYKVRPGDYLSGLAVTHGTSLAAVIAANCLQETTIYPDQKLWLPATLLTTLTPVATFTPTDEPTAEPEASTATPTPAATDLPAPTPSPTPAPPTPLPTEATAIRVAAATLPPTATPEPQPAEVAALVLSEATATPATVTMAGPSGSAGGQVGTALIPSVAVAAVLSFVAGWVLRGRR